MNQGYSLRAAAKIVGIAHTTFDSYKKRGIVTPDVADKKGEFSLFSEAQIELAKAYRAANPPKTKKQNPGNTSDNLFDEHAPNETIAAALIDRNSPADDDATNGDDKSEIELVVGDNDLEEKNTPAPVNDEDAPFEESDTFSFAEQNDTSGDSSGDNRLINTGAEYGVGDDDNTPPENSEATISQPANDEDAFKLDDPAEFNRASDDEHENQNVVGAPAPVARKLTVDEARALGLTYEEFMANQKGVTVEEYLESQRKRQEELQRAHEELFGSDSEGEAENLPAVASEVTVESPPFFDNSVVLLEEKTLQELADEGRDFFSRGDDCLKQGALYYVEGGRRLVEAKRRLKHGQWQEWLKANFSFSQDTAANYMKLAERFGGAKSETFRIFKPAVLIKMLALPAGDEDAFIEAQAAAGKPVEDLTAREVQRAVKEWNQQQEAGEIETFSSSEKTTPSDASPVVEDNHSKIAALVALDYEEENLPDEEPKKLPPIAHNRNSTTDWHTPIEYIEAAREVLGTIDLDPASSELANQTVKAKQFFTADDDGLNHEWRGRIWLNPPFNKDKSKGATIDQFVDKLIASSFEAAIILVDNATETRWFRKLADNSSAIVFTTGRINFFKGGIQEAGSPTRGQTFFYFGSAVNRFYATFQQFGWCAQKIVPPIIEAAGGDSDDAR